MTKVLVIATSRKTRGGITSVVKAHEQGRQWKMFHCRWIETHRDGNAICKLWYFVTALLEYLCLLPSNDLVHIHLSEPLSAIRKSIFLFFARLMGKKVITHFHAFSPETTILGTQKNIYHYLFSNSDRVIVLSNYWKRKVNECFNLGEKVQVIYNPCTSDILPAKFSKKKQILYAGTINARKGYADMIRAFAIIAPKHLDWQIVFAGNGEVQAGTQLAKELGIEQQTIFLGWVNGADKDKAFKESSIFCLPSYAEGFPMAVLDAWAYRLPVITTPVGGIPDIAKDGENLMLFTPGNIDELAQQMERLITDEQLRETIAEQSILLANTTFNIVTVNQCIEKAYLSC